MEGVVFVCEQLECVFVYERKSGQWDLIIAHSAPFQIPPGFSLFNSRVDTSIQTLVGVYYY